MDKLISLYQQHLNLQNATFSRIEHESAMVAIVYKITQPTGTQLILKICARPQDYLCELYFLKYFTGILPVPHIIQAVPPEAGVDGAILMKYLPGTLLTSTDFTEQLAYEIGSLLARIHLNCTVGYGDLTKPADLNPDPHIYFRPKFEENIAECKDHLPPELIKQCQHYYDAHRNLLATVDGPCIIHRDFWPGNVIVNDGKVQGIIDWSSGRAGFAEEDFCSLEHGEWLAHATIKKSFLAGYASIRPIPDYGRIMPLLRINKALATIGFTVKRGTWKSSGARIYQFNRQFLETFFNKMPL